MKRVISLLLSALLALSLAACGESSANIDQKYVDAVQTLKDCLKDPLSLRIYGDITVVEREDHTGFVAIVSYDGKNSYGAYTGATDAYVFYDNEVGRYLFTKDTKKSSVDIADCGCFDLGFVLEYPNTDAYQTTTFTISGEKIARMVGCEYIEK